MCSILYATFQAQIRPILLIIIIYRTLAYFTQSVAQTQKDNKYRKKTKIISQLISFKHHTTIERSKSFNISHLKLVDHYKLMHCISTLIIIGRMLWIFKWERGGGGAFIDLQTPNPPNLAAQQKLAAKTNIST